jgi:threonine aldolase
MPGIVLDPPSTDTNIVFWRLADPALGVDAFISRLRAENVRVMELGAGRIRAVTHYGITGDDISAALAAVARAVERSRPAVAGPASL